MFYYVGHGNLPYSLDDAKQINEACLICSEIKPRFYQPPPAHLIKSSQPFQRLSKDFKGPLPSTTKNHYFLTVVDEFSKFPFVFSCSDVSSHTVISCLNSLFSLFGFPAIVHSDNAKCFVPKEIKLFLNERGIGSTFSSICSPRDSFQCEHFNGMIWNTIKLALRTRGLKTSQWEMAIPEFLHGLWSLVRTATSEFSHDRFFKFTHRSMFDTTVPTWMSEPGPVYVRKHARVATSWKSPGKSWIFFAVLESPWILFVSPGKSWKMFIKFSRDFPGQNVKLFFFIITGTL